MYCVVLLLRVSPRQYFNIQNTLFSVVGLTITITKLFYCVFTYVIAYGLINDYGYPRKYSVQEREDKIIAKEVKANDPGML